MRNRVCSGFVGLWLLAFLRVATAEPNAPRVLSLAEAEKTAQTHQPQLAQARANTAAARARADEARAPILPQLTGTAGYQRKTVNFVPGQIVVPSTSGMVNGAPGPSFDSLNYFSFGLSLSQYIWDFGQTTNRWRAAQVTTEAQSHAEHATTLQTLLFVRTAYFKARAKKSLVAVARETLRNQSRHLEQVQGFVQVGTRPEIDLFQARTDRANAEVQVINAENDYEIAKAELNQAMGIEGDTDYDVRDESLTLMPGEEQGGEALLDEALKTRPELRSIEQQLAAQRLMLSAIKGGYGPSLGAGVNFTETGSDIKNLVWNLNASLNLTWPIFSGLLTYSQTKEAHALLLSLQAQLDTLRQAVRVEVTQARLQVRAAKATLGAAHEAQANARQRLRLAEARYAAGVGSIIELGDAELANANTAAQLVQADYNLSSARALFLKALGRTE